MDKPSSYHEVPGGDQVIAWFGDDLSFHDAEIIRLDLCRRGQSRLQIHWWTCRPESPASPNFVRDKDAIVTFVLEDILDLKLCDFSEQNVISELVLRRAPPLPGVQYFPGFGPEEAWEIELEGCYGLSGTIRLRKVAIAVVEGPPIDRAS